MTKPSPDQIAKLPKWAQEYITGIVREREVAVRALNKRVDIQTPSAVYYDILECTGESQGTTAKRIYVQSDHVTFKAAGVMLDVYCHEQRGHQYSAGIEIQWGTPERLCQDVAFIPKSFQRAEIVAKEHMQ